MALPSTRNSLLEKTKTLEAKARGLSQRLENAATKQHISLRQLRQARVERRNLRKKVEILTRAMKIKRARLYNANKVRLHKLKYIQKQNVCLARNVHSLRRNNHSLSDKLRALTGQLDRQNKRNSTLGANIGTLTRQLEQATATRNVHSEQFQKALNKRKDREKILYDMLNRYKTATQVRGTRLKDNTKTRLQTLISNRRKLQYI